MAFLKLAQNVSYATNASDFADIVNTSRYRNAQKKSYHAKEDVADVIRNGSAERCKLDMAFDGPT